MHRPGRFGNQDLDRFADELGTRQAEHLIGLAVHQQDLALLVDHDHATGRGIERRHA
jgi:hypothetical protein